MKQRSPLMRRVLKKELASLADVCLNITDPWGSYGTAGNASNREAAVLKAGLTISSPEFYRKLLRDGELGVADAYIDGVWDTDDLVNVFRIFIRSDEANDQVNKRVSIIKRLARAIQTWRRQNSVSGSKRNIHEHYDLGNDFFQLFLDESLNYSCLEFENDSSTLEEAANLKMDNICQQLSLQRNDHLIEIGTGWGGMACFAAKNYGCKVTTTTISTEQFNHVKEKIKTESLEGLVFPVNSDYRHLDGKYDKLLSVEMIEAVGEKFLPQYFSVCDRLLKPGGKGLIQAILIREQIFEKYRRGTDFIREFVFPGSFLPSNRLILQTIERNTNLQLLNYRDITEHYVKTLAIWRERFHSNRTDIQRLGFDERFMRLWDYYLAYCIAGFAERRCNDAQLTFLKL